jgi:hypothetical protein
MKPVVGIWIQMMTSAKVRRFSSTGSQLPFSVLIIFHSEIPLFFDETVRRDKKPRLPCPIDRTKRLHLDYPSRIWSENTFRCEGKRDPLQHLQPNSWYVPQWSNQTLPPMEQHTCASHQDGIRFPVEWRRYLLHKLPTWPNESILDNVWG